MRTVLELERTATDKLVLRVRRADARGNARAMAPVEGSIEQIEQLAAKTARAWAVADELEAAAKKEIARRRLGR